MGKVSGRMAHLRDGLGDETVSVHRAGGIALVGDSGTVAVGLALQVGHSFQALSLSQRAGLLGAVFPPEVPGHGRNCQQAVGEKAVHG